MSSSGFFTDVRKGVCVFLIFVGENVYIVYATWKVEVVLQKVVFEKYTKKDGKEYGPYLYENKRVGEKVLTKYVGRSGKSNSIGQKKGLARWVYVVFALVLVLFVIGAFYYRESTTTGRVSLDVNILFKQGEKLSGDMYFNIKEGEFIPADTRVLVSLGSQTKEFILSDLVIDRPSDGSYYAENSEISGSGSGFGVEGSKLVYPVIDFKLKVSNPKSVSQSTSTDSGAQVTPNVSSSDSSSTSQTSSAGDSNSATTSAAPSSDGTTTTTTTSAAPSSGGTEGNTAPSASSDSGITGSAIGENEYEISGSVQKGKNFVYSLEPGQTAEIVSGSVGVNGSSLADGAVSLTISGTDARVSTEYFVNGKGYGPDFLGNYALRLDVPIEKLGFIAEPGTLNINLLSNNISVAKLEQAVKVEAGNNTIIESGASIEQNSSIIGIANQTFGLLKEIPSIRILVNGSTSIDLGEYFVGAENYSYEGNDKIDAKFNGSIVLLTPLNNFKGSLKGIFFAYAGNNSVQSNLFNILVSSGAIGLKTSRGQIKVGEPVKWVTNVSLETPDNVTIELPKEAANVSVQKIESGSAVATKDASINAHAITGFVSIELNLKKESPILSWFKDLFRKLTGVFTGNVVVDVNSGENVSTVDVNLNATSTEYSIAYETPGPTAFETNTSEGKRVVISAASELNYTDVLSFADIPEIYNVGEESKIKIYWVENRSYMQFDAYDMNGNGKLDYVEWNTPHLSNQTFEIILITKAEHLDSSRAVVGDVYDSVKAQDGNTVVIPNGDYLRVRFEKNLTSKNDITIYASGLGSVGVYESGSDIELARFENISSMGMHKIYLSNLSGSQDSFDLLSFGDLQYDYVVDPTANIDSTVFQCGTIDSPGVYTLNQSISADETCITINSDDVVLDGATNQLTFDAMGSPTGAIGIAISGNRNNITIRNFGTGVNTGIYSAGTGTGIDIGINADSSLSNSTIENNYIDVYGGSLSSASTGITIIGNSDTNNISSNTIDSQFTGIFYISNSYNDTINGNTINAVSNNGISFYAFSTYNTFIGNNINSTSGNSIYFGDSANYNTFTGNTVESSQFSAIAFAGYSSNNVFTSNTLNAGTSGTCQDVYGYFCSGLGFSAQSVNDFVNGNNITAYGYGIDFATYLLSGDSVRGNTITPNSYTSPGGYCDVNNAGTCYNFQLPVLNPGAVSECGQITQSGVYTLTTGVSATGTCFTITADDVVLDGAGNQLTYNVMADDFKYGVLISGSHSNITIKNFGTSQNTGIFDGEVGSSLSMGIYADSDLNNSTIENNYVNPVCSGCIGISLYGSNSNNISGNSIVADGDGISIGSASYNTFTGNTLAANSNGISIGSASYDTFSGNNIQSEYYGIYFTSSSSFEVLTGNNIISSAYGMYFTSSYSDNTLINNTISSYYYSGIFLDVDYSNSAFNGNNQFIGNTINSGTFGTCYDSYSCSGIVHTSISVGDKFDGNNITAYGHGIDFVNSPYSYAIFGVNTIGANSYTSPGGYCDINNAGTCYNFQLPVLNPGAVSECGQITQSGVYTLTTGVSAIGNCFNIKADDVVLDGAGNQLAFNSFAMDYQSGILISGSHNNITIENFGDIASSPLSYPNFLSGVYADSDLSNSSIQNNTINTFMSTSGYGSSQINNIYVNGSSYGNLIAGNILNSPSSYAIVFGSFLSFNDTFTGNNITSQLKAMYIPTSSYDTIANNNINSSGDPVYFAGSSYNTFADNNILGYYSGLVSDNSYSDTFTGNNITSIMGNGLVLAIVSSANITGNNLNSVLSGSGFYSSSSTSNVLTGNTITSSADAISLSSSSYDNFTGNTITSTAGNGIYTTSSYDTFTGNNVSSYSSGIYLYGLASYNVLDGNNIESRYYPGITSNGDSLNNVISRSNFNSATSGCWDFYICSAITYIGTSTNDSIDTNVINSWGYGINFANNPFSGTTFSGNTITPNLFGGTGGYCDINNAGSCYVPPVIVPSCLNSTAGNGNLCTEGSSCDITSSCELNSNLCANGVCVFSNLTLNNATISLGTNESGDGNRLDLIVNGSNSTTASLITWYPGSSVVFSGANGTRGGNGGILNITVPGLFNTTFALFVGQGGYSSSSGVVGGNGGEVYLNYHGLVRKFTDLGGYDDNLNPYADNTPQLGAGDSLDAGAGSNGGTNYIQSLSCPRDPDITDDGAVDIVDVNNMNVYFESGNYGVNSTQAGYNESYDIACKDKVNVAALARIGFQYNSR